MYIILYYIYIYINYKNNHHSWFDLKIDVTISNFSIHSFREYTINIQHYKSL
jgi:hypothetical protein